MKRKILTAVIIVLAVIGGLAGVKAWQFHKLIVSGTGAAARNSIGIMIVAGMTFGTLFTLLVIPSIYALIAKEHGGESRTPVEKI
jgi:multidrug efflux pump subunit AcrB